MEGDQGNAPTLPQGLTLFLVEDAAEEQDDAPGPIISMSESFPQLLSEGPQHHPTHTGGARPKAPIPTKAGRNQIPLAIP